MLKQPNLLATRRFARSRRYVPNQIHPPVHHFVPRLFAPANVASGIRIARIVRRIVPDSGPGDSRSFGYANWFGEAIDALPVEIVVGHGKQCLASAVWPC